MRLRAFLYVFYFESHSRMLRAVFTAPWHRVHILENPAEWMWHSRRGGKTRRSVSVGWSEKVVKKPQKSVVNSAQRWKYKLIPVEVHTRGIKYWILLEQWEYFVSPSESALKLPPWSVNIQRLKSFWHTWSAEVSPLWIRFLLLIVLDFYFYFYFLGKRSERVRELTSVQRSELVEVTAKLLPGVFTYQTPAAKHQILRCKDSVMSTSL